MSGGRKRLKLHAYFKKEIWVILHKCWIFMFFSWKSKQSTVLTPEGGTPFCSSLFFFILCLIREVKNSASEKRCSLYKLVCIMYTPNKLLLSPSPHSRKKKKGSMFTEPGTVPPGEQWWCGQEWWGHGLCPSARGWAGQPGQGRGDQGGIRRSCASPRWDAQLLPSQAQAVTASDVFPAHPSLEEWDYK